MDDHDLGLAHDLDTLALSILQRRRALGWLAGALSLFGCGGGGDSSTSTSTSTSATSTTTTGSTSTTTTETSDSSTSTITSCSVIPEETSGPYPGDGSNNNGLSVLTLSGIVRSDIRSSIAGATGTAQGVPLTVKLTLVNANAGCADLSGYAIYLWHCDRDGKYSLYSAGVTDQNYLRGVQETASDGTVSFTTIFRPATRAACRTSTSRSTAA